MAETALKGLGLADREVSVLITLNPEIKELNKRYRKINKETDVLSFPMEDPVMIGDIVISMDKAELQAEEFSVSIDEELSRLVAHGTLHLAGYDHVKGGRQAKVMKEKEEELIDLMKEKGLC